MDTLAVKLDTAKYNGYKVYTEYKSVSNQIQGLLDTQYRQVEYSKDNKVKLITARTIQSRLNTARTIKSSWIQQGQYTVKLDTARTIIQSSWIQQGLLDTQYRQVGYSKEYWIHNTVRLDTSRITGYTISSGWIHQGVLDTQY